MRGSVVVTGASSGIGAATARLLGERGFRVFAGHRKPMTPRRCARPGRFPCVWT